ncbi:MAG: dipeptide ABC transporter ATP-binding protein [Woeseiaceae bacterium]
MSKPLLSVKDLNVSFASRAGNTHAVKNVSFEVAPGEIVGIVGESGSGKSVSCRAVLGLLPDSAKVTGQIHYQGQDILGLDSEGLRRIRGRQASMVFQNPASHLDPLMTVGRQVSEPLVHHEGVSQADAHRAAIKRLQEVQLDRPEQRVNNYPHELSGGMKQRVMIAAAIACGPGLLLADEPTTALDVTVQARILELLRTLNEQHELSIVLVSHDLAVVAQVCDRVLVMRHGEIVETGDTQQVIYSPQHPYTQQLVESQPSRMAQRASQTGKASPLLEVNNINVEFALPGRRKLQALDEVSLTLNKGETMGIVGESGSGKSTLARVIMGLVKPASGDVQLNGASILQDSDRLDLAVCRKVQMAFQNPFDSLNPRYSIYETIAEPIRRHMLVPAVELDDRVAELLRLVELDQDLADRKPSQLSGGQCQRVGIARALAMDPELLIADEITSALDVTIQAQIIELLNRLCAQRNLSVIFISHDLALVRSFCDQVLVFQSGRIVEGGSVSDVLERPKESYTQELLNSAPRLATQDAI